METKARIPWSEGKEQPLNWFLDDFDVLKFILGCIFKLKINCTLGKGSCCTFAKLLNSTACSPDWVGFPSWGPPLLSHEVRTSWRPCLAEASSTRADFRFQLFHNVCPFLPLLLLRKFRRPRSLLWQWLELESPSILNVEGQKVKRSIFNKKRWLCPARPAGHRARTYLALTVGFSPWRTQASEDPRGNGLIYNMLLLSFPPNLKEKGTAKRPAWLLVSGSIRGVYFNS